MQNLILILYSRKGCCLCQGLENTLTLISLESFRPKVDLKVVDIDHPNTSVEVKVRYDHEVPKLALFSKEMNRIFDLPRPSPRFNEEGLCRWLQKEITKISN